MAEKMEFSRTKEYLICVDSDGCVMDTMNRKHFECFGPKIIEEWNLEKYETMILEIWNEQNLFSRTRGINRFLGLSLLFQTLHIKGITIPGQEEFAQWCKTTTSLSNDTLKKEIVQNTNICLNKALSWSYKVNESIQMLKKVNCVFPNAKETLRKIHEKADVVIVSSANQEAILEEWYRLDCMKYADMLCGQEAGTKSVCIAKLQKFYEKDHVLMIGDALSDLQAAQDNGVAFYPILAGREADSWKRLKEDVLDKFLHSEFDASFIEELAKEMERNFKK